MSEMADLAENGPTVENGYLKPRTITFTVTLEVDGDIDMMDTILGQYLTSPENFVDDYGPDAWGGYDGPFVTQVEVTSNRGKRYHWKAG